MLDLSGERPYRVHRSRELCALYGEGNLISSYVTTYIYSDVLGSIFMNLSPESVPRLVSAAASNILEGELEERVLTQVPRSLLISCGSPKYKKLFEKVEDADGEQNELKTLQGQVVALLYSQLIRDPSSVTNFELKSFNLLKP